MWTKGRGFIIWLTLHQLACCHVMRKQPPASMAQTQMFKEFPELFLESEGLACGYHPAPGRESRSHFSGTLLILLFDWIPKPCATPLLLRWYGSYFQHIITAAVSPPPEWSPVPHVSCHGRHGHLHLCYAKVLRRHKGFSNYLFLKADVLMRPSRLISHPLDHPWLLSLGGYSTRRFGDNFVDGTLDDGKKNKDKAQMKEWWETLAAAGLKRFYEAAAGGPKMPVASVTGVANVPAMMGKYFVTIAESMAEVRGEVAQSMIFDMWDVIPGSQQTFLIAENESLWMHPNTQRPYEDYNAAFTHPLWLSDVKEQQMLDDYLSQHTEMF